MGRFSGRMHVAAKGYHPTGTSRRLQWFEEAQQLAALALPNSERAVLDQYAA
jgi:Ser/Thr protein kinase RdoA (MazF antagonist)